MRQPLCCPLEVARQRLTAVALISCLLSLLTSFLAQGQPQSWLITDLVPIDGESGDIVYADHVRVAGASASSLYNRAHRFLVHTLQAGSLRPMAHGAKHQLSQCGIVSLVSSRASQPVSQDYRLTVEIRVKAGRYRYRLSQFRAHPHRAGAGVAIRDLYPCDQRTYSYSATQAQAVRAWHGSVQGYIGQLQRYMAGSELGLSPL